MVKLTCVQLLMVACFQGTLITMSSAELPYDFYSSSCPKAEETIRNVVYNLTDANPSIAAALIRLHFHDCFAMGCDASILLDSSSANPQPEKSSTRSRPPLRPCVLGRSPAPTFSPLPHATQSANPPASPTTFTRKGLNIDDLVALSGAHSIGVAHCSGFTNRLYPEVDTTMDAAYATDLKKTCPEPVRGAPDPVVNNSGVAPTTLSNQFFKNAIARRVLFTSDAALLTSDDTRAKVEQNAADSLLWKVRFAASMVKMGNIEVLTGTNGQVRKSCRAVNT
ncbi:hypothetical protein ZWY2020_046590 [Hordeum vulgare]|nr:hypothetical protein ZWY2020_046590 [Hordeum vulgare]